MPFNSGFVVIRLVLASITPFRSVLTRLCEVCMLDWILWKVPIELLKPWWCSSHVSFEMSRVGVANHSR